MCKFGPKQDKTQAGRPAYPYDISSCYSSEMLLSKISSKYQVFNTITINKDQKASTKFIWAYNQ